MSERLEQFRSSMSKKGIDLDNVSQGKELSSKILSNITGTGGGGYRAAHGKVEHEKFSGGGGSGTTGSVGHDRTCNIL